MLDLLNLNAQTFFIIIIIVDSKCRRISKLVNEPRGSGWRSSLVRPRGRVQEDDTATAG